MAFPDTYEVDSLAALQARHITEHDGLFASLGAELCDGEVGFLV
jgi:hypothetical protein